MKKKKNAFTLIELLAIIVILAIIAVITVPIILNIIENSRKGAATDSAYGYKDSVNKTYIAELQNHNKLKLEGTYTVNSDGSLIPADENTDFNEDDYDSLDVQVSGTIPSSGELTYENNVLKSGYLVIGDYRVTFNSDGTVTTVKNTGSSSNEQGDGGNNGSEVVSNPYLTTFDGNYIAYSWDDASTEGYTKFTQNPTVDTMEPDEYDECDSGYEYNNGMCYMYSCTGNFSLNSSYKCEHDYAWFDSLNSESKVYTRATSSSPETCGVFGTGNAGTVCMTSSYYNSNYSGSYASDFSGCSSETYDGTGETCLKGYAKAKADEMISKGASSCFIDGGGNVTCTTTGAQSCGETEDVCGSIDCNGNVVFTYNYGQSYSYVYQDGAASNNYWN